jgi:hypothetical protein
VATDIPNRWLLLVDCPVINIYLTLHFRRHQIPTWIPFPVLYCYPPPLQNSFVTDESTYDIDSLLPLPGNLLHLRMTTPYRQQRYEGSIQQFLDSLHHPNANIIRSCPRPASEQHAIAVNPSIDSRKFDEKLN